VKGALEACFTVSHCAADALLAKLTAAPAHNGAMKVAT
jgi:hypothetical protein